jgi:hypothetical protein
VAEPLESAAPDEPSADPALLLSLALALALSSEFVALAEFVAEFVALALLPVSLADPLLVASPTVSSSSPSVITQAVAASTAITDHNLKLFDMRPLEGKR